MLRRCAALLLAALCGAPAWAQAVYDCEVDISAPMPSPSGTGCSNVSFSTSTLTISGDGNIRIYGNTNDNQITRSLAAQATRPTSRSMA